MIIIAGTPVVFDATFTGSNGAAVDPGTVTIHVRHDDTIDSLVVSKIATGHYRATFTPTEAGSYLVQAKGTGVAHSPVRHFQVAPGIEDVPAPIPTP